MADEKQYKQISDADLDRTLAEHWRWLRNMDHAMRADLMGYDLSCDRLKNAWSRLLQTGKVTIQQENGPNAVLDGSDQMPGIQLQNAYLDGANLENADLSRASLQGAMLPNAHLEGANLHSATLDTAHLVAAHLEGANLSMAQLQGTILTKAHLKGANLREARSQRAILKEAHLEGADLMSARLEGADLQGAHLEGAKLARAQLKRAKMAGAHLEGAILRNAEIEGAHLGWANLNKADLAGANLKGTILTNANISGANLMMVDIKDAYLTGIIYNKTETLLGARIAECFGDEGFVRFANDQAWLEDFIATRNTWWQKFWAGFWKISSDYGRSIEIWAFWSFIIAVFFAYMFTPLPDCITNLIPDRMHWLIEWRPTLEHASQAYQDRPVGFFSALYFSVVTFTTLGFGDIVAANFTARILVALEVIVGYIMLGGLISIFANKFARRS